MLFMLNTGNIQYFLISLDIQVKYNWKSISSVLYYVAFNDLHNQKIVRVMQMKNKLYKRQRKVCEIY